MGNMGKFISDLILEILSWLAEEEITLTKQRQMEGMESARAKGVVFGRPRIEIDDKFISVYNDWADGKITAVEAIKLTGMSKATFYRRVADYEESLGIDNTDRNVKHVLRLLKNKGITEDDLMKYLTSDFENLNLDLLLEEIE